MAITRSIKNKNSRNKQERQRYHQRATPFQDIQKILFSGRRYNTRTGQTVFNFSGINNYLQKEKFIRDSYLIEVKISFGLN